MSYGIFNLARMTVASSGTGNITLNAAVSGFLTFDLAGCSTASTGEQVTYAINDTTQSEIARGTYYSSSLLLTRGSSTAGMKSTNGNSPISMSNAAQVFITPSANDLNNAQGNCYLGTPTATSLTLSPLYGNRLFINGVNYEIPSGGVSLASTGASLTSSTYYYVYAYMNSGTMTLEPSTTSYVSSAWNGVATKSGDPTRTLVGLTFTTTTAGGSSNWATGEAETVSWYNPKKKVAYVVNASFGYLGAAGEMTPTLRLPFSTFSGRAVDVQFQVGSVSILVAQQDVSAFIGLDGSAASIITNTSFNVRINGNVAAEFISMGYSLVSSSLSEGRHFAMACGASGATAATFSNWITNISVNG